MAHDAVADETLALIPGGGGAAVRTDMTQLGTLLRSE
jgi:hypothetical protein